MRCFTLKLRRGGCDPFHIAVSAGLRASTLARPFAVEASCLACWTAKISTGCRCNIVVTDMILSSVCEANILFAPGRSQLAR